MSYFFFYLTFSQLSVDQAQDSLIKYFFTSNEAPFI